MSRTTRSTHKDAQLRRTAVKRYRAGIPAAEVARQLHHSRSWVYKWVHYRDQHPWTRFRSMPPTSFHHPNQLSAKSERRIVRLRQLLTRHRQPRLRFAAVGPRTIQKEWCRRYSVLGSIGTDNRLKECFRHHLDLINNNKTIYCGTLLLDSGVFGFHVVHESSPIFKAIEK